MTKNNETKRSYNPNRDSYLSVDGTYYIYRRWDDIEKRHDEIRIEVGKDGVTLDLLRYLDDSDYSMDVGDDREDRHRDPLFETMKRSYDHGESKHDPVDQIADGTSDTGEDPDGEKVRAIVDTQLTESQQELYYRHFGLGQQLEEIRRDEVDATGQDKTLQSVLNRKNKIIKKIAKQAFDAEPVKRHKYPNKK